MAGLGAAGGAGDRVPERLLLPAVHPPRDRGRPELLLDRAGAFESADREEGVAVAAHIAVAVAAARRLEAAEAGLHSRSVIGQAMGIVMERFSVGPDQALALLHRLSSHANTKLRDIAVEIVATRRIVDADDN